METERFVDHAVEVREMSQILMLGLRAIGRQVYHEFGAELHNVLRMLREFVENAGESRRRRIAGRYMEHQHLGRKTESEVDAMIRWPILHSPPSDDELRVTIEHLHPSLVRGCFS